MDTKPSKRLQAAMITLKAVVRDEPAILTGLANDIRGDALDTLEQIGRYVESDQPIVRKREEARLRLADALDILAVEAGQ